MEKAYKWLNSHSRLFLERGYLEEGVTPEKRIRDIAENAERILREHSWIREAVVEESDQLLNFQ